MVGGLLPSSGSRQRRMQQTPGVGANVPSDGAILLMPSGDMWPSFVCKESIQIFRGLQQKSERTSGSLDSFTGKSGGHCEHQLTEIHQTSYSNRSLLKKVVAFVLLLFCIASMGLSGGTVVPPKMAIYNVVPPIWPFRTGKAPIIRA